MQKLMAQLGLLLPTMTGPGVHNVHHGMPCHLDADDGSLVVGLDKSQWATDNAHLTMRTA